MSNLKRKLTRSFLVFLVPFLLLGSSFQRLAMMAPEDQKVFLSETNRSAQSGELSLVKVGEHEYAITITKLISKDDSKFYDQVADLIRGSTNKDVMVFHMGTVGGDVDQSSKIIDAIKSSAAFIKINVVRPTYSAGSMISCYGDEIKMAKETFLMFHDVQISFTGQKALTALIKGLLETKKLVDDQIGQCINKGLITQQEYRWMEEDLEVYKMENGTSYLANPYTGAVIKY